jgi:glycine C-acetyltransferase
MADALGYLQEELDELKTKGLFRWPRLLESEQKAKAKFDHKIVVNLSSNNYLGLITHPKIREAAKKAIDDFGVGSGAVRTIAGNMTIHKELEEELRKFKKTEAVLLFQSGFTANAGTVSAILGPEDVIISDQLNHASIIDGCRLSKAQIKVFPHKDLDVAEKNLKESQDARRRLLITDGVFSMDGDIAPLPELVKLAKKYNAIMMVDDAHASGVLGNEGRGTVDHFNLHGQVDIQVGTLSKAFACLGGYVAGSKNLIDYLVHRGRPILFSTSHPPSVAATALTAIKLVQEEPEHIQRLWDNTKYFKENLREMGFDTGKSETPITPILVGDEVKAMQFSDGLFTEGVFVLGIVFPTVPRGAARLRANVTAAHTQDDLDFALQAFEKVGQKLGII